MIYTAQKLEAAGADIVLICTNSLHKFVPEIQREIHVPILNIVDATARKVLEKGLKKVGLLGTKMTMEENFYTGRISEKFGINVLVPDKGERDFVDRVIIDELCVGKINEFVLKRGACNWILCSVFRHSLQQARHSMPPPRKIEHVLRTLEAHAATT